MNKNSGSILHKKAVKHLVVSEENFGCICEFLFGVQTHATVGAALQFRMSPSVVASSAMETCAYPRLQVEIMHAATPDGRVARKKFERIMPEK